MTMVHKFSKRNTLFNSAGSPSSIGIVEYYTNNMFRVVKSGPEDTHQPLYFDQMMAIYNTFTVIGSKIKITFLPNSGVPCVVGVFLNDKVGVVVPSLTSTMVEQTGSKNGILGAEGKITRTYTWSAKKRIGGSILGNTNLSGSNTAGPAETNTYVIYMQDFAKTTKETINYLVEIEYIAVWTGLRDVGGS